jgi:hypothetical protein
LAQGTREFSDFLIDHCGLSGGAALTAICRFRTIVQPSEIVPLLAILTGLPVW